MKVEDTAYKTLRKIQMMEENSPLLTKIDQMFYSQLSGYQKNPNSIYDKEGQTIEKIFIGIYQLREKKIVQAAFSTTRGGKPDLKNILDEEKRLFDSIVEILIQSRKQFLSGD